MESFELQNEDYDISQLDDHQPSRPKRRTAPEPEPASTPSTAAAAETVEDTPRPRATRPTPKRAAQPQPAEPAPKKQRISLGHYLVDGRLRTFLGVLFILVAGYMLVASISYLSTAPADQSIVLNSDTAKIADHGTEVTNSAGWVGALLSHLLMYRWLGLGGFVLIFYVAALGITLVKLHHFKFWQLTFKSLVSAIAISIIAGFLTASTPTPMHWGGQHGYYLNKLLIDSTSYWGAGAVSILMATALILIFIAPIKSFLARLSSLWHQQRHAMSMRYKESMAIAHRSDSQQATHREPSPQVNEVDQATEVEPAVVEIPALSDIEAIHETTSIEEPAPIVSQEEDTTPVEITDTDIQDVPMEISGSIPQLADIPTAPATPAASAASADVPMQTETPTIDTIDENVEIDIDAYDPTAELSRYRFPSIDLLQNIPTKDIDPDEQDENKATIIQAFKSYGVEIQSIKATVGPTITLYEIIPAEGVRVHQIKHLGDDMQMKLSAKGIRIIAPMPGKGTIGMEVPNKHPQTVSIRSILSSRAYHESTAELPLALGTTITNEVYVVDLAKIPHLLVAGATGMGKSVGLNTIIASLLYKKHPAELKFVLIDPKMVEFSLYRTLEKHYLAKLGDDDAVITDPSKVVATLNALCVEMDNRYALLSQAGQRGIKEYNKKFISRRLNPEKGHRFLPYIVVIIDEFADLILTAGKEVETPISRIAAKARAVGIHIILATQRPSVNVITGVIKANFPGRMAFRVTQMNDSRTILDRPGADQLVGKGDMLISRDGIMDRLQCAFIDTDEVESICSFISDQIGYAEAYPLPEPQAGEGATMGLGGKATSGDFDPLIWEAGALVTQSGQGSTSMIQRKLDIGYPRAGKIMDQLEKMGVVGAVQGAKPRQVFMTSAQLEELKNRS